METFHQIIGTSAENILWWQMVCRGILIFCYTLLLVRFGGLRIFVRTTSFEIVLGIMIASMLSRATTGSVRFIPTLATATALVLLHRGLLALASAAKLWRF